MAIVKANHQAEIAALPFAYLMLLLAAINGFDAEEECSWEFNSSVSKSGNFSSPHWPLNYPNNVRCLYNFFGQQYEVLNITFFVFDLEPPFAKGCLKDYIDISTITAFSVKKLIGRYCGNEVPSPVLSMHPRAELIFKSNHVISSRGFYAMYQFIDESLVGLPKSTISTKKGCGGVAEGSGGIIESPNFPAAFPEQIDCMWVIRVRQDQHIYLKVMELQLFGSIANCKDAQLAIYDGYENYEFNPKEPKRYCGDQRYYKGVEDTVELSASNRLLIRFKSDITAAQWTDQVRSQEIVGFRLVWTAVSFKERHECKDFLCQGSEYCLNPRNGMAPCTETRFFCIDQRLVCNGLPNCSEQDSADEDKCAISIVIGASAGAAIVLLFLIICCYCCCRRQQNNRPSKASLAGSSAAHLRESDASMQLRQLEHSPSFGSGGDGLSFFPPPPPPLLLSHSQHSLHQSPMAPRPDSLGCSVHGPRAPYMLGAGGLGPADASIPSLLPTDV